MSGEQLVDVTYRGIEVGKSALLSEFGPTTAFVEVVQPMPVGSALTLATDGGFELHASVLRVVEQIAGVEHPGMRLRVADLEGDAKSWWDAQVTEPDPEIPEPAVQKQALPEDAAPAEQAVAAEEAAPAAAEASVEAAPEHDAVPEAVDDAVTEPNAQKKRKGRKKKKKEPARTMVMDVAEIQAAIAEGGDDLAGDAPADEMSGNTIKMAAVDIDAIEDDGPPDVPAADDTGAEASPAEDDKKKKARKRRRRSRRK